MGNLAGAYSTTAAGGIAAFQDRVAMQQFFAAGISASMSPRR
jgi:hypothetical protein